MDKERRKKLQTTKLIFTEIFMLIAVVLTVVVLTFVVMGYNLSEDGKIEQNGLLSVESVPSGATVYIDGEAVLQKTTMSRLLSSGEHEIVIKKDGFTDWSRTVKINSGYLTKLAYPRLFKTERGTETVKTLDSAPAFLSVSPDRSLALYAGAAETTWHLLSLRDDSVKDLNFATLFNPSASVFSNQLQTAFSGEIKNLTWSQNGDRVLLEYITENETHFAVLNIAKPDESLDLARAFNIAPSTLEFATNSGDKLYLLENGNLRTVSLSDGQLSAVLAANVVNFTSYNSQIAYVVKNTNNLLELRLLHESDKTSVLLKQSSADSLKALLSEYLGKPTLAVLENNNLTIYRGELPSEDVGEQGLAMEIVGKTTLDFAAKTLQSVAKRQAVLLSADQNFAVFDLETAQFSAFKTESSLTFWTEEYIIGTISDEQLVVRDFDGENRRVLGKAESFPAVVSANSRYLYYVTKDANNKFSIVKDNLR